MAKRKLLQWMRENLKRHADQVVACATEKKALEVAYEKAEPLVSAIVTQKFPRADMKILKKWQCCVEDDDAKLSIPDGAVIKFEFQKEDYYWRPDGYSHGNQIFLANATVAAAVEKWIAARDAYKAERAKRLNAYYAMIDGSSTVEDLIAVWPEAAGVLPAGSPPIPLGPEQVAIIKADLRERKAA